MGARSLVSARWFGPVTRTPLSYEPPISNADVGFVRLSIDMRGRCPVCLRPDHEPVKAGGMTFIPCPAMPAGYFFASSRFM
jgi:hypothetical protein